MSSVSAFTCPMTYGMACASPCSTTYYSCWLGTAWGPYPVPGGARCDRNTFVLASQCGQAPTPTPVPSIQPVSAVPNTAAALGSSNLPDLVPDATTLKDSVLITYQSFNPNDCQAVCISGFGNRTLLKFSSESANLGGADLIPPSRATHPELYEWHPCHQHWHFKGFAEYLLLDSNNNVVRKSAKQSFCMEDVMQVDMTSPDVPQNPQYTCSNQGISRGWSDVYMRELDCQWIDITGVPNAWYKLQLRINPDNIIEESNYSNNVATVWVHVDL